MTRWRVGLVAMASAAGLFIIAATISVIIAAFGGDVGRGPEVQVPRAGNSPFILLIATV